MKAVLQRVTGACVAIDGETQAQIGQGFLLLLGVRADDTQEDAVYLADKCTGLRVFSDAEGKMNRALADIGGELLVVSNFTLYADCSHGRRPGFTDAARPEIAIPLYEFFCEECRRRGAPVKTGVFGADMQISLTNDGPITIVIESQDRKTSARSDKK